MISFNKYHRNLGLVSGSAASKMYIHNTLLIKRLNRHHSQFATYFFRSRPCQRHTSSVTLIRQTRLRNAVLPSANVQIELRCFVTLQRSILDSKNEITHFSLLILTAMHCYSIVDNNLNVMSSYISINSVVRVLGDSQHRPQHTNSSS